MAKKRPAKKLVKKPSPPAKTVGKKTQKTPASKKKARTKKAKRKTTAISLGRPKVTAEEKLYMLFKDDYQARQLFEFLQVASVGELEQFSPAEIVDRLSQPLKQTVQRIRKLLAGKNRSLRDDQEFAARHGGTSESDSPQASV